MQLHLVGGFLGSGKTTAILAAARELISQGKSVGIITNDQGKYLVDTSFFKLTDMPTVEVTGGCFCCNYDDLDERLDELIEAAHPDVIFAESVGSCTDLVATVIKPMLSLRDGRLAPSSFSVFVDCRLLRLHLMDNLLPFADDVIYIFDKQIEEAGLVIINKTDLLPGDRLAELVALFQRTFPQKAFVLQNTLAPHGTSAWLQNITSESTPLPKISLELDYQRYGAGEAELAWLDEEWIIPVPQENGRDAIIGILNRISTTLKAHHTPIGHLKFMVDTGAIQTKISLTTLEDPAWLREIPAFQTTQVRLLVNGRVQMEANQFKELVDSAFQSFGNQQEIRLSSAFHPAPPSPLYRYSNTHRKN